MFEDPAPHQMGSPTPMVRPLDDSQRPSPFHGHGSWLVCEVALRNNRLKLKIAGKLAIILEEFIEYTSI